MGSLCQRMTEDLKLKNYAPATRSEYLRCAKQFAAYHMRSPAEMGEREIRDFLLALAFERKGVETLKMHIAALKFLYSTTLRRPEEVVALPWPKVPQRLPGDLTLAMNLSAAVVHGSRERRAGGADRGGRRMIGAAGSFLVEVADSTAGGARPS